ncbi:MAG TPA: YbaK/EbsC family protein [Anaerolineae bacterium]|nr:YbaK/EbsC family protein [Anaerolineae bacterium]
MKDSVRTDGRYTDWKVANGRRSDGITRGSSRGNSTNRVPSSDRSQDMLTPGDLARYIESQGIDAALVHPDANTPTVPAAAAAVGVSVEQIIKSLLFFVQDRPYLVIANGTAKVNTRRIATHFGVGRKKVRMARATEIVSLTGYPPGGVPPFGHRIPIPVLLDKNVLDQDLVYGGGGNDHTLLCIRTDELMRVAQPTVVDVCG